MPAGAKIAFVGGADCNDHTRIWEVLDKARAKHPDMVLLHGGSAKGAERIAACWAQKRRIAQVVFKPVKSLSRATPFRGQFRPLCGAMNRGRVSGRRSG